jgi:hypothetical protein
MEDFSIRSKIIQILIFYCGETAGGKAPEHCPVDW